MNHVKVALTVLALVGLAGPAAQAEIMYGTPTHDSGLATGGAAFDYTVAAGDDAVLLVCVGGGHWNNGSGAGFTEGLEPTVTYDAGAGPVAMSTGAFFGETVVSGGDSGFVQVGIYYAMLGDLAGDLTDVAISVTGMQTMSSRDDYAAVSAYGVTGVGVGDANGIEQTGSVPITLSGLGSASKILSFARCGNGSLSSADIDEMIQAAGSSALGSTDVDSAEQTVTWGFDGSYRMGAAAVELVPEPATLSLVILGGLGLIRRRR